MKEEDKKRDMHGTEATTRWIHHHRRLATWILKLMVAGVASFLYYLRKQETDVEKEQKNHNK